MLFTNFRNGIILFILTAVLSLIFNYNLLLKAKKNDAKKNSEIINSILSEQFDKTEIILISIGKRIALENPDLDYDKTLKILTQSRSLDTKIFSWSLFSWLDNQGYQRVNSILGVRQNPPLMAPEREYLNRGNDPWKMVLCGTVLGNPSEDYVIPVGVQIEDNKRLGTIAVGISVKKLSNLITSKLGANIRFMVISERDSKFVFGSHGSEKFLEKLFLQMPHTLDEKSYVYEKRTDHKYSYKIWVGYDQRRFWQEVVFFSFLLTTIIITITWIFYATKGYRK